MEHKLWLVIGLSCLPTLCYLVCIVGRLGMRRFRGKLTRLGADGAIQVVLVAVAVFCFVCAVFTAGWVTLSGDPYYHLQRMLVLALLFLLMGVFCVQLLQFVRMQDRRVMRAGKVKPRVNAGSRRSVSAGYGLASGPRERV